MRRRDDDTPELNMFLQLHSPLDSPIKSNAKKRKKSSLEDIKPSVETLKKKSTKLDKTEKIAKRALVSDPEGSTLQHKTKRQRLQKSLSSIKPRENSRLSYFFFDGASFNGWIKLLQPFAQTGNFHFGPKGISFSRSDPKLLVLNFIRIFSDKCLLNGGFKADDPGFYFGVNLQKLGSIATHALTKNDSFMIFFEEDNSKMFTEQLNNRNGSRNVSIMQHLDVHEFIFDDFIREGAVPDIVVRADIFSSQCGQLSAAKCPRALIHYAQNMIVLIGLDASGQVVKRIPIHSDPLTPCADIINKIIEQPTATIKADLKVMKSLINLKHTSLPSSMVRIYFEGPAIRFVSELSDFGEIQTLLRDESVFHPNA
jgi:hypothetical protein